MSIIMGILAFFVGGAILVLIFKSLGITLNYIFPILIALPLLWYFLPILLGGLFAQHENNRWHDHFDESNEYLSILNTIGKIQPSQIQLLWMDPNPVKTGLSFIPCMVIYDANRRELMRIRWPDRHSDNLRESMKRFPEWLNQNLDSNLTYRTQEISSGITSTNSYTLTQIALGRYSIHSSDPDPIEYGIVLFRNNF